MTSTEKATLFSFLDTAQRWITAEGLPGRETPRFTDDAEPMVFKNVPSGCTLNSIKHDIEACQKCALAQTRKNTVPGEGPDRQDSIRVMVIGDGPGTEDDSSGRPFVDQAGQLLDKMLQAIQLTRGENCFITHTVKCRLPDNREPAPDEITACRPFLETQIALIRPTLILALGATAAQTLLATTEGINALRGRLYDCGGIPVLPTFHPADLLLDESLKRPAWEDLKLFRSELDRISG